MEDAKEYDESILINSTMNLGNKKFSDVSQDAITTLTCKSIVSWLSLTLSFRT